MFGATKLYPYFVDMFGFHGTFWLYSGVSRVVYPRHILALPRGPSTLVPKSIARVLVFCSLSCALQR